MSLQWQHLILTRWDGFLFLDILTWVTCQGCAATLILGSGIQIIAVIKSIKTAADEQNIISVLNETYHKISRFLILSWIGIEPWESAVTARYFLKRMSNFKKAPQIINIFRKEQPLQWVPPKSSDTALKEVFL